MKPDSFKFLKNKTITEIFLKQFAMELFKTNKLLLTLLFIYPIDKDVKLAWKYLINFGGSFIFCIELIGLLGSIFYLKGHLDDLADILYVFFQVIVSFGAIATFVICIIIRRKFEAFIETMQNVYDSSENLKLKFLLNLIINN